MTNELMEAVRTTARVCHEANRAWCASLGDTSQPAWEDAPAWQRDSAINGVVFHLKNPEAGPSLSHSNWLKEKVDAGWVWGPIKDPELKQHPCIVPYAELPHSQQMKDALFVGIVHAMFNHGV